MRCYDLLPAAADAFIAEMAAAFPALRFVTCDTAVAAAGPADVVVTAIPIVVDPAPDLDAGVLRPGALAVSLDYDSAWTSAAMRECDKFCADDVPQLLATRDHGVYFGGIPASIHADLGDLAAGTRPGRETGRRAHLLDEHGDRRGRHGDRASPLRTRARARRRRPAPPVTGLPAQSVLDEQGCRSIHEAALKLLGEVGCAVLDAEARELLRRDGARVDGERVRFGETLVEQARASVPAGFTVAGRRPELDLRVALDAPPVLASASGPPFVLVDGAYRPGTLDDLRTAIALAHLSPNVQVVAYALEPNDVPDEVRPRVVAHAHVTGTDKSARYTVTTPEELRVAHRRARDPLGRGLARTAARPDGHQHDLAPAVLPGRSERAAAPGAARPARAGRRLRHGRHDGAHHPRRPARRPARRAARRPGAHAARAARRPVHLRRHLVALVHADAAP